REDRQRERTDRQTDRQTFFKLKLVVFKCATYINVTEPVDPHGHTPHLPQPPLRRGTSGGGGPHLLQAERAQALMLGGRALLQLEVGGCEPVLQQLVHLQGILSS